MSRVSTMSCASARCNPSHGWPGTPAIFLRFMRMQYVIYFVVATPLLLGWLIYEAATQPTPRPLFASGYESISAEPQQKLAAAPVANSESNTSKKLAKNETSAAN